MVMKNAEGGENQKSFSQVVTDSLQKLPTTAMTEAPKLNRTLLAEGGEGMQQSHVGTNTLDGREKWKNHDDTAVHETLLRKDNDGSSLSEKDLVWQTEATKVEEGW